MEDLSVVEKARRRQKLEDAANNSDIAYMNLDWIPSTSVVLDSLSSRAKLTQGDLRKSMSLMRLEAILFWYVNKDLWNYNSVYQVIKSLMNILEADIKEHKQNGNIVEPGEELPPS